MLTLFLVPPEAVAAVIKGQVAGSTRALGSTARKKMEIWAHDLEEWR
jgi:hypothetical protein